MPFSRGSGSADGTLIFAVASATRLLSRVLSRPADSTKSPPAALGLMAPSAWMRVVSIGVKPLPSVFLTRIGWVLSSIRSVLPSGLA